MRYHYYTNNKNTVVATSTYAGQVVRGVAKCSPNDKFDLDYGRKLARARLDCKVAEKRHKRAYQKYQEAMDAMVAAQRHYEAMEQYYDDAWMDVGWYEHVLHITLEESK